MSSDLVDATASEPLTTVGVTGQSWRASVTPWGSVLPWGDSQNSGLSLDWHIAADDRWHSAAIEPAVRQHRIAGTPVTETRMRIPDGDAVQRVWSVASYGGFTIVEIENDSPLPFAVAFSGMPVVTERAPSELPIQGIELPAGSITLPVGHHTTIRVGVAHGAAVDPQALRAAPPADAVARGWTAIAERASRLGLPDEALSTAVVSARCDLMLDGPVDADDDPTGFILDVGELVRLGEPADAWLPEIVEPLAVVASGKRSANVASVAAAIEAAGRIARAAGDTRAAGDADRMRQRLAGAVERSAVLGPFSELRRTSSVGRFVTDVERHVVFGGGSPVDLLPAGIPASWLGSDFEVHGIPTSASSSVSFAVRWHGERPAVLWDQQGPPVQLSATAIDVEWSTAEPSGEALWKMEPPKKRGLSVRDSGSFS